jgi:shikimate kinase
MRRALFRDPFGRRKKSVSLIGFMGTGKSTVGRILADRLGFRFVDSDELIEKQTGKSVAEIFKTEGEVSFRKREKEVLTELLGDLSENRVVSWGGGIVMDGQNREMVRENSLAVWLFAAPERSLRLIPKGTRPLLDVDDPAAEAQRIFAQRKGLYAETADILLNCDAEYHSPQQTAEKIYEEISQTL